MAGLFLEQMPFVEVAVNAQARTIRQTFSYAVPDDMTAAQPVRRSSRTARAGLQIHPTFMPIDRKIAWIEAEAAVGVAEIKVTSNVPPKLIPLSTTACERAVNPACSAARLCRAWLSAVQLFTRQSWLFDHAGCHVCRTQSCATQYPVLSAMHPTPGD